ncbi:MAG: transcriptional regulator [Thermoproteota archaeon]|nr:transcriptional regulator [Thermoproteota archaeon]
MAKQITLTSDNNLLQLPHALFFPGRIHIMKILYSEGGIPYVELRKRLQIADGSLVANFRYLEKAGFTTYQKQIRGRKTVTTYSITEKGRKAFEDFRKHMLCVLT